MAAIEKRGESSYRLTISCGYDKTGKKKFKKKTIDLSHLKANKQLAEAEKQFHLFQAEVEKGTYLDAGKMSFVDFIDKWLKDYAEPSLAPKTLFSYKEILYKRIIPSLGHIKLNKLQPTHLVEFYNNLREDGMRLDKRYRPKEDFINLLALHELVLDDLIMKAHISYRTIDNLKKRKNLSPIIATDICKALSIPIDTLFDSIGKPGGLSERTILYHHRIISSILTCAVQWQFILNNPATRLKPPKIEKKEVAHFDTAQTDYIFRLINEEPIKYKAMLYLCIYGGMRAGELNALEWADLNWEDNSLKINKASQYLPGQGTFTKSTKNQSSERVISLPDTVMSVLRAYKLWQNVNKAAMGDLWIDTERIFTRFNGEKIFPQTLGKWFSNFITTHNEHVMNDEKITPDQKKDYLLDTVTLHGLRHTSATLLISQNVDIATVSKRLGHASISTTLNIYTHALEKLDRTASDKLENLFINKESKEKQG
ncbi:MAG TPA: site-specific integrase [Clostridiaceae bacterium]